MPTSKTHQWNFYQAGGFNQVNLATGKDLLALDQLNEKLWVALGCPTKGLQFDKRTLELLDKDKDGVIRSHDIIEAVQWVGSLLKDPETLVDNDEALEFASIKTSTDEGKAQIEAAKTLAHRLGKEDATSLTVEEATKAFDAFLQSPFNGDGVLPPASGSSDEQKLLLQKIMDCMGGTPDVSGVDGVDRARIDGFFQALEARKAWLEAGEKLREKNKLGEDLEKAYDSYSTVKAQIDDYFTRCHLLAFDPRSEEAVKGDIEHYKLFAKGEPGSDAYLKELPVAAVTPEPVLPLTARLNPAYSSQIEEFLKIVVHPLLGDKTELTENEWTQLKSNFADLEAWSASEAGVETNSIGKAEIEKLLEVSHRNGLNGLLDEDERASTIAKSFGDVEKLARYQRDLHKLCKNFVSFEEFYDPQESAIFQAGTLYLDQRSTKLCIQIENVDAHAKMGGLAGIYIAYCECTRGSDGRKKIIAAAITSGDSDELMVGRNGVFYDRTGQDWSAKVIRIVDHPISLGQAFWSPYKKLIRWVEAQVLARASAAESVAEKGLTKGANTVVAAATKGPEGAKAIPKKRFDVGVIAALGVAVSGLTAALGAILEAFFGLGIWMPLGVFVIIFLISGPSMVIAYLKLRRRSIGPLLDANGWAVNARAVLNVPFGRSLTAQAELPDGAVVDDDDPFEVEKPGYKKWIFLGLVLITGWFWQKGKLDKYLPAQVRYNQAAVVAPASPKAPKDTADKKPPEAPAKPAPTPEAAGS